MTDQPADIYSPPGTKLEFHGNGGWDYQKKAAREVLTEGAIYTLKTSRVGGWETEFYLEEVPGSFNSCMFSPAPEGRET